jgi:membrane protease subunit (stomatin/prohibitin family)
LFINSLSGTMGVFTTENIEEYLSRVIVSRLNDYLGENLDTLFDLPGQYDELSEGLQERLKRDFGNYGLALHNLYINAITPPPDVQQAIDDKSRLGVFDNLDRLVKMKAAMAMEKASENQGEAGAGMGMGMGLMMPALFAQSQAQAGPTGPTGGPGGPAGGAEAADRVTCTDCGQPAPADSRFCPHCGAQVVVLSKCANCSKNLPPGAKFCPRCGAKAEEPAKPRFCTSCGAENLSTSVFCNQCGNKM